MEKTSPDPINLYRKVSDKIRHSFRVMILRDIVIEEALSLIKNIYQEIHI